MKWQQILKLFFQIPESDSDILFTLYITYNITSFQFNKSFLDIDT